MSVRVQLQVIAEHRNMLIMSMMRNNIPSATANHRSHSGCTLPSSCNLLSKLRVEVIQMQVKMTKRDDRQPFYDAQEEDINGLHTFRVTTAYQNQAEESGCYKKFQRFILIIFMLMGNRSPDEFYLCTQRCRIGNAPLNYRQTETWKTMWHPLYRSYIRVIIIGLPFVIYKLHAGIELVECEAVLDSNPVRSCKLNVQRNIALDSKIS
ncbi:hypothetical protein ALC60_04854 [Trachymyrmex zeteki]|uniref:Uncharacterized protein n=1 Tax=Mycetomoellerius zeteki TaxID=64791 RepID=A0A151X7F0_9HYME|nr:hypothetical protein ALC60_04854 [Trachymyrmex zeteki]